MSDSFNVFVGPYLRLPLISVTSTSSIPCCSGKCGVTPPQGTRFCCNCGQPVEIIPKTEQSHRTPYPHELADYTDWMWMPESTALNAKKMGHSYWLPNHKGYGVYVLNDGGPVELSINLESKNEAILEFLKYYAPYLEAIRKQWGIEPQVQYGILGY